MPMNKDDMKHISGGVYVSRGKYHSFSGTSGDSESKDVLLLGSLKAVSTSMDDPGQKVALEAAKKALMELEAEEERRKNAEEYRAGKLKKELKKKMRDGSVHIEELKDEELKDDVADDYDRRTGINLPQCRCVIL